MHRNGKLNLELTRAKRWAVQNDAVCQTRPAVPNSVAQSSRLPHRIPSARSELSMVSQSEVELVELGCSDRAAMGHTRDCSVRHRCLLCIELRRVLGRSWTQSVASEGSHLMEMVVGSKLTRSIWTTTSRRVSLRDASLELVMGRLQGHETDSETKANIARSSQTATGIAPQAEFEEPVNRFFKAGLSSDSLKSGPTNPRKQDTGSMLLHRIRVFVFGRLTLVDGWELGLPAICEHKKSVPSNVKSLGTLPSSRMTSAGQRLSS